MYYLDRHILIRVLIRNSLSFLYVFAKLGSLYKPKLYIERTTAWISVALFSAVLISAALNNADLIS